MRAGNLMTVTGFAAALVVATLCQGQSNDIDVVALRENGEMYDLRDRSDAENAELHRFAF